MFSPLKDSDALIFFKFFDGQKLEYVGKEIVPVTTQVANLLPLMRKLKELSPETKICVYEEIRPSMIDIVKLDQTLNEAEISTGDILVFQVVNQNSEAKVQTVTQYYEYLNQKISVQFRNLSAPKDPHSTFRLDLTKTMNSDTVAQHVAQFLKIDPLHIRFIPHIPGNPEMPKPKPLKRNEHLQLSDMLSQGPNQKNTDTLYYEVLSTSVFEIESKKSIKVHWQNSRAVHTEDFDLLIPKGGSFRDIAIEIAKNLNEKPESIRFMEIDHFRIRQIILQTLPLNSINGSDPIVVYAEPIGEEENGKGKVLPVSHIARNTNFPSQFHLFGNPFTFFVKQGEKVSEIRVRIQKKLGIADEEFEKWKFWVVSMHNLQLLKEDEVLLDSFHANDFLGLEHADLTPRAKLPRRIEKPVVIHN